MVIPAITEIAERDNNVHIEDNGDVQMRLRSSDEARRGWRKGSLLYAAKKLRAKGPYFEISARVLEDMANHVMDENSDVVVIKSIEDNPEDADSIIVDVDDLKSDPRPGLDNFDDVEGM